MSDATQAGGNLTVITWRDCGCEWFTKFCEEQHVKHALVDRTRLDAFIAAEDNQ